MDTMWKLTHRWTRHAALGVILTAAAQAGAMNGSPVEPPVAKVLGDELHATDPDELRYLILQALSQQYAAEQGIQVTEADIDAYVAGMARIAEKDRREREARRQAIERQLAAPGGDEAERQALTSELDSLNRLQRDLDEMAGQNAEDAEEARQARRTVAAAFVRQWKLNQALFRQYGGRVIFQQGGPEPLDAYRRFLEERRQRGDFEILDQDLDVRFWRYYRTDSLHSFYPSGSEEEKRAFDTPWWLSE